MRILTGVLILLASLTLFSPTRADSVSVGFSNGILNTTPAIVNYKTTGAADMGGMAVTFYFSDENVAPVTSYWASGSNSLGTKNGVTLSLKGDSYYSQWNLYNSNKNGLSVTKMVIDAGLGDTVFDQTFGNMEGTPLSSAGKTFSPTTGAKGLDIVATYSDLVAVQPNAAVKDLYRTLTVEFTNQGGLAGGKTLRFWADTDTVEPLTVPQNVKTPAPPALLLALLGVPLLMRRRPEESGA